MKTKSDYTPELRERAVRLLLESERDYPSRWSAICSIASKVGCTPETLRTWIKKAEDQAKPMNSNDLAELNTLKREVRELKRANEILRKAAAFFAQAELDRKQS